MNNYDYLAARLGLKGFDEKPNIHEAQRTWQLYGFSVDYRYEDEGRTEDENQVLHFALESGLPEDIARQRIKICQEVDELLARANN